MTDGTSDKQGHVDPRVPERDICVLRYALDKWAHEKPDQVYAVFEDGSSWTYRETLDLTVAKAAGLAALGVKQGDHVAMALPNGKESLLSFFAINYLGAVYVPFNTAYKGRILEHVVANSDASIRSLKRPAQKLWLCRQCRARASVASRTPPPLG